MSMKRRITPCLLAVLVLAFAVGGTFASLGTDYLHQVAKTMGQPTRTTLNINLLSHWIMSDGLSANDPLTGGNGIFFPRGTYGAGVIYTDGLLWGGQVNDGQQPVLRVGGTAYTTGLIQGKLFSKGVAEDDRAEGARLWRIRPDYETADLRQDAAELQDAGTSDMTDADVEDVRAQYQKDWEEWPWDKGAPFYDVNGNGRLDWGYEEDTNGNGKIDVGEREEPGYAGADQVIWFVANDYNEGRCLGLYGSPSIGMEVQVTLWGYNRTDALGNIAFKKYKLIYKGTAAGSNSATIDSMYFAMFSDPDLGEAGDDLVGCDTTLNMMYVYNSVTQDIKFNDYNLAPPAAGYDFLQGPVVETGNPDDVAIFGDKIKSGYVNLGMTNFNYFAAGSAIDDPDREQFSGTEQWYQLMHGLMPRIGTPFVDNEGNPTDYPLSGNPVLGTGDLDGNQLPPGDRRCQMITGPVTMALGDTQEVVIAVVVGLGADRLSSISVMKYNDISAQYAYDNFFELAKAPPSPKLKVTNLDREILLNWGWSEAGIEATEMTDQKGYLFEGYNIYQLPTSASQLSDGVKLATYDVANEITTILDSKFDATSGQILQLPVQIGSNSGIKRTLKIKKDAITGRPLVNGTAYYFAVTAYSYNGEPDVPIRSLESAPLIQQAVPQSPNPGVRYQHEAGEDVEVAHTLGVSDGSVSVTVVDPTLTTGHKYSVTFDTLDGGDIVWNLYDSTAAKFVLENQTNQSGDDNYLIVDGVKVVVEGPSVGFHGMWQVANAAGPIAGCDEDVNENIQWINFLSAPDYPTEQAQGGWVFVTHGGGTANDPESFIARILRNDDATRALPYDFEMRFTAAGARAIGSPDFANFEFMDNVPFEIWNIGINTWDDPSDDYQMIPIVYDIDGSGTYNFSGDDPSSSGDNDPASDWVYWYDPVDKTPGHAGYDAWAAGTDPTDTGDEIFARTRLMNWNTYLGGDLPETGTVIRWITNKPNAPGGDVFAFSTLAPSYDKQTAGTDIEKINVYPNPYYGMNPRESTAVDRFVSFNHLPQKATFRVFDLAGTLVRKLDKDDSNQFFRWDLRNHNELPVASGIYIIHIDMPDLGKVKILKLAIVREAEFIEVY